MDRSHFLLLIVSRFDKHMLANGEIMRIDNHEFMKIYIITVQS